MCIAMCVRNVRGHLWDYHMFSDPEHVQRRECNMLHDVNSACSYVCTLVWSMSI